MENDIVFVGRIHQNGRGSVQEHTNVDEEGCAGWCKFEMTFALIFDFASCSSGSTDFENK